MVDLGALGSVIWVRDAILASYCAQLPFAASSPRHLLFAYRLLKIEYIYRFSFPVA